MNFTAIFTLMPGTISIVGPILVGISIPTVGVILVFMGFYAYRNIWPMLATNIRLNDNDEKIDLVPKQEPIIPRPPSKLVAKPLTIARILADDIKPDKDEYAAIKDQDMRLHRLKFSQNWGTKFSSLSMYANDTDTKPVSLNRYVLTLNRKPYVCSYIFGGRTSVCKIM